jgi:hypothetical protein
MRRVFISYRRRTAAGHAGRLHDAIEGNVDCDEVFMDVRLRPGVAWLEHVEAQIADSAVVLALGPQWRAVAGRSAERALRASWADLDGVRRRHALGRRTLRRQRRASRAVPCCLLDD